MVNTRVIEFLKKAQTDKKLASMLNTLTSLKDVVNLAEAKGFKFTEEDLIGTTKFLQRNQVIQEKQNNGEELSEEELLLISGGQDYSTLPYLDERGNLINFREKMTGTITAGPWVPIDPL